MTDFFASDNDHQSVGLAAPQHQGSAESQPKAPADVPATRSRRQLWRRPRISNRPQTAQNIAEASNRICANIGLVIQGS